MLKALYLKDVDFLELLFLAHRGGETEEQGRPEGAQRVPGPQDHLRYNGCRKGSLL